MSCLEAAKVLDEADRMFHMGFEYQADGGFDTFSTRFHSFSGAFHHAERAPQPADAAFLRDLPVRAAVRVLLLTSWPKQP